MDKSSAQEARSDPIRSCGLCHGRRILVDLVGESVCAWCDGTGLEHSTEDDLALVERQLLVHFTTDCDPEYHPDRGLPGR